MNGFLKNCSNFLSVDTQSPTARMPLFSYKHKQILNQCKNSSFMASIFMETIAHLYSSMPADVGLSQGSKSRCNINSGEMKLIIAYITT